MSMRITRANLEEMQSIIEEIEQAVADLQEPVEMWLDEDTEREDRADARQQIPDAADVLESHCQDFLKLIDGGVRR